MSPMRVSVGEEGEGHSMLRTHFVLLAACLLRHSFNSLFEFLLFLLLYVAWKIGRPQTFACVVLFHPIKKRSFNLLCVLDPFSECWQSALFQIFFVTHDCNFLFVLF